MALGRRVNLTIFDLERWWLVKAAFTLFWVMIMIKMNSLYLCTTLLYFRYCRGDFARYMQNRPNSHFINKFRVSLKVEHECWVQDNHLQQRQLINCYIVITSSIAISELIRFLKLTSYFWVSNYWFDTDNYSNFK